MTDHVEDDDLEVIVELEEDHDERHPLESEEALREPREIDEETDESANGTPRPVASA
jgi:hypothetical protein